MTRQEFLGQLREGLKGLPVKTITDIAADYEAHFNDAEADGRSEAEVAEALGDPRRLARELRAEAGLKRWEAERSPSAAGGAIAAVAGLGALDLLILLPLATTFAGILVALYVAAIVLLICGAVMVGLGPVANFPGGPTAAVLIGLGTMSASACVGAVTTLVVIGLVNVMVWYGRLHYRLLQPAINPKGAS